MKQPEQSYTAIETAHGFVFFTDTTEGQKTGRTFCNLWQTITSIPISILVR